MIAIQAKKHDNFSVEFKFGFNCTIDGVADDFAVNAWIFVPNSLDITPENYGKDQFYRDIKSNVRLITPSFSLEELAKETSLPLMSLKSALAGVVASPSDSSSIDTYEYHLKMFAAIYKSALRNQAKALMNSVSLLEASEQVDDYVVNSRKVLLLFRELYEQIKSEEVVDRVRTCFQMCNEFMAHVLEVRTLNLIKTIDASHDSQACEAIRKKLTDLLLQESAYRKQCGYALISGNPKQDRRLVHHFSMLKKYIESELYIRLDKKKDGVALQQIYYSLAAGFAMVFATAVSWYYQERYGSVTWPLFVVLVISYMLKDRIKDLLRYYFAHKLGNKYYDKKAQIAIGKTKVGAMKEGFDFISDTKLPKEVRSMRDNASFVEGESSIFEEKIMLYRQRIVLDDKALVIDNQYRREGVNEILRLHLYRFTHKMDNPLMSVDQMHEDGRVESLNVQKVYYINVVFQLVHDGAVQYKHFRIGMSRDGIFEVEPISPCSK